MSVGASKGVRDGEWHDYAGDTYGLKYSPLSQIHKDNVKNLRVAWKWTSADVDLQKTDPLLVASRYEDTPLIVNGMLYTATPLGVVAALDPATGQPKWTYDPESYKAGKPHSVGYVVRGLSYWSDGKAERILHSMNDGYLVSIDAKTGKPDPAFGTNGKVDLMEGVTNGVRARNFTGRRPVIAGDIAVVGSAIQDAVAGKEDLSPKGFIKAYDVRTGRLLWTFNLIPKQGEVGYETWLEGSAERTGNANAWGGMAYDPDLDYVYAATSAPGNDYYGALRPGANLFADSLICFEAKTGKRVWHFQAVHHDLWDYDLVTHPSLADITVSGRRIKAVVGLSKNSFVYVLDRKTGAPVWPIVETPVPQANTPNREWTSPTQPIPSKPPAPETQGSLPGNIIDFTPELKARALEQLKDLELGPLYTPPTMKGTLRVPGSLGGANWGGAAFDPETGVLYVPTRLTFDVQRPRFPTGAPGAGTPPAAAPGRPAGDPTLIEGLPVIKPPYARVTAIDLNKGERLWMTPIGNGPRQHPLLKDLALPPLGDAVLGAAPLVTKTLLFVGVTYTFVNGQVQPTSWEKWNDPGWQKKVIYAFDKKTGAILHVVETDNLSAAAPMTYLHKGTQYLVVATGQGTSSELVAYTAGK
jgi:quinoprotein glucose dehydrogenase